MKNMINLSMCLLTNVETKLGAHTVFIVCLGLSYQTMVMQYNHTSAVLVPKFHTTYLFL